MLKIYTANLFRGRKYHGKNLFFADYLNVGEASELHLEISKMSYGGRSVKLFVDIVN